jgi:hypothetical protein
VRIPILKASVLKWSLEVTVAGHDGAAETWAPLGAAFVHLQDLAAEGEAIDRQLLSPSKQCAVGELTAYASWG